MSDEPEPARPTLGSDHSAAREATEAAVRVVKQLQVGLDDAHNRHLADERPVGQPVRRDRAWLRATARHPCPSAPAREGRTVALTPSDADPHPRARRPRAPTRPFLPPRHGAALTRRLAPPRRRRPSPPADGARVDRHRSRSDRAGGRRSASRRRPFRQVVGPPARLSQAHGKRKHWLTRATAELAPARRPIRA
jgi:hypothetical protein